MSVYSLTAILTSLSHICKNFTTLNYDIPHKIITNTCRKNHGPFVAYVIAEEEIREEYLKLLEVWEGKEVNFRLVLMVERLEEEQEPEK